MEVLGEAVLSTTVWISINPSISDLEKELKNCRFDEQRQIPEMLDWMRTHSALWQ